MFEFVYGAHKPMDDYSKTECHEMYLLWLEKAKADMFLLGYLAAMPSQMAAAYWYGQWEKK